MMNGWQWYESISKALEMSPCLFNWSPFQAIPGNPPPPPLSEVIDQNNNGSGGECNCHLTSTRLTIIPPQKNTTFVIQENWNQIGNELMEGVRLLHPFGRLGFRRRRAWEKNWPHGTGLHMVKNRSYLRHYATLHGTLQCSRREAARMQRRQSGIKAKNVMMRLLYCPRINWEFKGPQNSIHPIWGSIPFVRN